MESEATTGRISTGLWGWRHSRVCPVSLLPQVCIAVLSTVLVIAHRMAMVEGASHIVVLEGGTMAKQGTHTELVAHCGPHYHPV